MPIWLRTLGEKARQRPVLACLVLGVVGWLAYTHLGSPAPPLRPLVAKAQTIAEIGARPVLEASLHKMEKENVVLREAMADQTRALQQLQQATEAEKRERQLAATAQEQRMTDLLQKLQQAPKSPATAPPARPVAAPPPKPLTAPRHEPPSPGQARDAPKVRILRSDKPSSFAGSPPSPLRAETPFLPAGSYAEGRLVTGVFATARQGGALPVLFTVAQQFHGPYQLRGPGLSPLATALPIEGCLLLGKAQADLASERGIMQLETLSCVFPDGATFERPLKGYVVGMDGTLGMDCRLETRDSAYLARTFLTSLMSGAAEAFALAQRTVVVTPFGGTTSTVTGNVGATAGYSALANATAKLSEFYLQQAERLMPVLWCESGAAAKLVLQEGLALEGFPLTTTFYAGEQP